MNQTPEEIIREYRQAMDKNKAARILADQNSCSIKDILTILRDGGAISGTPAAKAARPAASPPQNPSPAEPAPVVHRAKSAGKLQPWEVEEERRLLRLARDGVPHTQIAEQLGRTPTAVSSRLTALRKRSDPSPTPEPQQEATKTPAAGPTPKMPITSETSAPDWFGIYDQMAAQLRAAGLTPTSATIHRDRVAIDFSFNGRRHSLVFALEL